MHKLHKQHMLHHVGEIPRVIMVSVVHAVTGTFTTTLRTNIGAPAATSALYSPSEWPAANAGGAMDGYRSRSAATTAALVATIGKLFGLTPDSRARLPEADETKQADAHEAAFAAQIR